MESHIEGLRPGSYVTSGASPKARFAERQKIEKELTQQILSLAFSEGVAHTAQLLHLSETSVVKVILKNAKRQGYDLSALISFERQKQVQEFIFEKQTLSIKKLVELAQGGFSEAELRIAKALIQPQDVM